MIKNEKILEVEDLLQSLSEEMLKLKTASKHYDETKENLQSICESIDKISITHQKLTENMSNFLVEMETIKLENKKMQEFIQGIYDEAKILFRTESERHEAAVEASLSSNYNKISEELKKQIDKILVNYVNQSKTLGILKYLVIFGIILNVFIIIKILLF